MIVSGNVAQVLYESNGFYVVRLNDKIVVQAFSPDKRLDVNTYIEASGNFEITKHGKSFRAESIVVSTPIMKHVNLLPIYISGLGAIKAEEIKKTLGPNYLMRLSENPKLIFGFYLSKRAQKAYLQWQKALENLPNSATLIPSYLAQKIKGLSIQKATHWVSDICDDDPKKVKNEQCFYEFWASATALKIYKQVKLLPLILNGVQELKELGYSEHIIPRLIAKYKENLVDKIKENPYIPFRKYNIPFEKCDQIALSKLDMEPYNKHRILNGVYDVLQKNELKGNTYLDYSQAITRVMKLLSLDDQQKISDIIYKNAQTKKSDIYIDNTRLYRRLVYKTEREVGEALSIRIKQPPAKIPADIEQYLKSTRLIKEQQMHVRGVLENNVSILTGGPGTGKTTCLKALCNIFHKMGKTYALAAPTGRASKRISETTGRPAKTLHRLLEYQYMGNFGLYMKNHKNQLNYDYIIVDEASMVDIFLMSALLKATPLRTHIILVGDVDQLPSISIGALLKDLKNSGVVPVHTLTKIHRQSKSSEIVKNAYRVKNGELITDKPRSDFLSVQINAVEKLMHYIDMLVAKGKSFQVLCPTRIGPYGTDVLNEYMQKTINKKATKSIVHNNKLFKIGDKIIQTDNDYIKEVFNGEIGTIADIQDGRVIIDFPQNTPSRITYTRQELSHIDLAYAITIHKSQGSEFDNVLIVFGDTHAHFLTKELVYTGITRAKKGLLFLTVKTLDFYQTLPTGNARITNLCNLLTS